MKPDWWCKRWTPEEDALVLTWTGSQHSLAQKLGRTAQSVASRKYKLKKGLAK